LLKKIIKNTLKKNVQKKIMEQKKQNVINLYKF